MKIFLQAIFVGALAFFCGACAHDRSLTIEKVSELTTPAASNKAKVYKVTVSSLDLGRARGKNTARTISVVAGPEGTLRYTKELKAATAFDPPQMPNRDTHTLITPAIPSKFEPFEQGWVIHVSARPCGKLISVQGSAQFTEVTIEHRGFGPISGPIYSAQGNMVSPNTVLMPKVVTTTTYFSLFAVPGENYDVTLYSGNTPETHTVSVVPK